MLNTLQHNYSFIFILSLSISRKYVYLTAPISKYLNTSPYSSLTKFLILESNLYNFSSSYNLIFSLSLTTIFLILHISYILQILHPTKHLCLYHLHTSQEMSNTHTKSPSHGRHELLLLKPFSLKAPNLISKSFSYNAQLFLTNALLLEGTTTSYIKPFSSKTHILHTKVLLMEENSIHNFTTIKRALSKGKLI